MHRQRFVRLIIAGTFLGLFLLLSAPLPAAGETGTATTEPALIHLKSRQVDPRTVPVGAPSFVESHTARWHGLIQLAAPPNDDQRAQLSEAGVQLLGYIPENSWLASLPADVSTVYRLDYVRWIGALLPQDRVEPAIQQGDFAPWARVDGQNVTLEITPFADVPLQDTAERVMIHGGRVIAQDELFHRLQVELPAAKLWALAAEDGVQWIAQTGAPLQMLADGSRAVIEADVVQSSPYNLDGSGVQIGMWDAGLADATHTDFGGRLIAAETYPSTQQQINHATHVAGILGGDGSLSAAHGGQPGQWRGIAPGADIISFHWQMAVSDHDAAINDYGIDISQNSWAIGACYDAGIYDYWSRDYDAVTTGIYGRRVPVIFAAGNQQQRCDNPYGSVHRGPQTAKNVLTVGGIRSSDGDLMSSSSWGPVDDGRLKPELVAAGQSTSSSGIYSTIGNNEYGYFTGTSMAAPAVSGSIALLLEQHQNLCGVQNSLLPSSSKALLIHGAADLADASTTFLHPGPDYASGFGRVNDRQTVELLDNYLEGYISHGASPVYPLQVTTGQAALKVTLVWDDVPAEPNAAPALVNDLDLELIAPDGSTVYSPWILDPANPGNPAQRYSWKLGERESRDRRNVVEQVVVDTPQSGTWLIRVSGSSVPQGPQSFSLVGDNLSTGSCGAEIAPTAISWQDSGTTMVQRAFRNATLILTAMLLLATATLIVARRPAPTYR